MAKLIFLGTGAALPTDERTNTSLAVLVDANRNGLLIDCGGDVFRSMLRSRVALDGISDLFITHAHIDHIGSLPSLLESLRLGGRTTPLHIWALPQVMEVVHGLIRVFDFELKLDQWSFDVAFSEVKPGEVITLAGIPAHTGGMDHAVPALGLRLELPDGALAYTSDTQPNPNIAVLGQGARTLITECTFLSAFEIPARASRHLTAHEAGELATSCGVERLVLVHGGGTPDDLRAEAGQAFNGQIIVPSDGDSLDV
jgi:ribonuclease Z